MVRNEHLRKGRRPQRIAQLAADRVMSGQLYAILKHRRSICGHGIWHLAAEEPVSERMLRFPIVFSVRYAAGRRGRARGNGRSRLSENTRAKRPPRTSGRWKMEI